MSDVLIIGGFLLVLGGLWWLSPAAALIVGGLGLMATGLFMAGQQARTE